VNINVRARVILITRPFDANFGQPCAAEVSLSRADPPVCSRPPGRLAEVKDIARVRRASLLAFSSHHPPKTYNEISMPLLDRIQSDMVAAMKSKDEERLGALRMMKAALKKHEIDAMKPLDDNTELQVLNTLIKQRRESADMFRKGNRTDLAEKEERESKLIESYMPSAPNDEEIEAAINSALAETGITSPKQMGVVMKAVQAKLAGKRVDGKALSDKVRARLS